MPKLFVKTEINADINICFDLARDIGFYYQSLQKPTEIPISGKTSGLVEMGDYITWETNHLHLMQHLTLKISEFIKPSLFVDNLVEGEFKSYRHEHRFQKIENGTLMTDVFYFESSYSILGKFVDYVFLKKHFRKLLENRNNSLKQKAEELSLQKIL